MAQAFLASGSCSTSAPVHRGVGCSEHSHRLLRYPLQREPQRFLRVSVQRNFDGECRSFTCSAAATDEAELELVGEDAQRWHSSLERIQALGFEDDDAEKILRKAFGWGSQGYWRKSKVKQLPADGQVDAVLEFLTESLRLKEADVQKAVKTFPEVLGLDLESQIKGNVEKLKKDWKMTDKVIPNVVKRQPQVLGYNVDCEGNCLGECNRCWVRF